MVPGAESKEGGTGPRSAPPPPPRPACSVGGGERVHVCVCGRDTSGTRVKWLSRTLSV